MAITYIIRSAKRRKFYVGSSHFDDIKKRLSDHNAGRVRYTKSGIPWTVIEVDHFETYTEARKRENFLKTGVGRKWIYENFRDN